MSLKVVFLTDLPDESSSGLQRLWALRECGAEVHVIDKQHYSNNFGLLGFYAARVTRRPQAILKASKLAADLVSLCAKVQPDIVWLEWLKELDPSVLQSIKRTLPKSTLISFQDDNPWGDRTGDEWMWKKYFKLIPEFDVHLVKRESDFLNLTKLGAKCCRIWEHGIYAPLYHLPTEKINKKYLVSFVGTAMDKRGFLIRELLKAEPQLHIFGTLWTQRFESLVKEFPNNFHAAVVGNEYAKVIRESYLSLIMVSESNKDEWTMRSYEVPGCATAALVPDTPKHREMFKDQETGFFYNSAEDCVNIIKRILHNPKLALAVGEASHDLFHKNKWTLEERMRQLLADLFNPNLA